MENGTQLLLARELSKKLNNMTNIIYIIEKIINLLLSWLSQIVIAVGNHLNLKEIRHSQIASVTINLGIIFTFLFAIIFTLCLD